MSSLISPVLGVSEVALWVQDLDQALQFYRDKLGFALEDYSEGQHAFLRAGDFLLVLFNLADPGTPLGEKYLSRTGGPKGHVYHVAFRTAPEELDNFASSLRAKGVAVSDLIVFPKGRRSYFFEDPDDHYIEITDR